MSLANIQGKMSRMEMRNIMAGSGGGSSCSDTLCTKDSDCCPADPHCRTIPNWSNLKACAV
jgi:hypothetical protein